MTTLATLLKSGEGETIEFKERWNSAAMEAIAAFANSRGGTLVLGVNDKKSVTGWREDREPLATISNQIVDTLRIQPSVKVGSKDGRKVVIVQVSPTSTPVACKGRYYRRVGNTTREIPPDELGRFLSAIQDLTWDAVTGSYGIGEIDPEAVRKFIRAARKRLPSAREEESVERVLEKLELVRDGRLTRGAILLFGLDPQRHFIMAQIHMGRFKDDVTIVDDKMFTGNLFQQLEQATQLFQQYLQVRYEIKGQMDGSDGLDALRRRETWEYPLEALREAVLNALIHRDYAVSADVQIRVYDDRVTITNAGGLPEGISVEELRREGHASVLRNPRLAKVCYYAGLIEKWGTGTTRMIRMCQDHGLPEPEFRSDQHWFELAFSKDPYTPERLKQMGLNGRQIKGVAELKKAGSISNEEYMRFTGVSKPTATRDLSAMVDRGILQQSGRTGRGTRYTLKGSPSAQRAQKRLKNGSKDSPSRRRG